MDGLVIEDEEVNGDGVDNKLVGVGAQDAEELGSTLEEEVIDAGKGAVAEEEEAELAEAGTVVFKISDINICSRSADTILLESGCIALELKAMNCIIFWIVFLTPRL